MAITLRPTLTLCGQRCRILARFLLDPVSDGVAFAAACAILCSVAPLFTHKLLTHGGAISCRKGDRVTHSDLAPWNSGLATVGLQGARAYRSMAFLSLGLPQRRTHRNGVRFALPPTKNAPTVAGGAFFISGRM